MICLETNIITHFILNICVIRITVTKILRAEIIIYYSKTIGATESAMLKVYFK